MTAHRLLAHFDAVVDTPDAVQRLRRFILDLAVRGKLVPQDPNDEPASELLKLITKEKNRLVEAREIRRQKPLRGLSREEMPFTLPVNWAWSQVAEIGVLSPRNRAPDDVQASFVPMSMIASEYRAPHRHEIRRWAEIRSGYTHFAEGDVGLAKITPCFENGKSTVFRNLAGGLGSGTTELHIVRPLFVDPRYVVLFLKCPYFIEAGIPKMTGTAGQKRVPAEYFANSPFPLPPLFEQRRIVARVDELMALCDRLDAAIAKREATRDRWAVASLARLSAPEPDPMTVRADASFAIDNFVRLTTRSDQIKTLRRTILNLAVRGVLVAQNPSDEPASKLLDRIAAEKARLAKPGKARKRRDVSPVSESEIAFVLPSGWSEVKFADVIVRLQTGPFGSSLHRSDYRMGGTPVINPASMKNGKIVPLDKMAVASNTLERLAKYKLQVGDIVMARRGEMGRCSVVTEQESGWLCGTGSLIIHLPLCINASYLAMLIRSPMVREYLNGYAVGATMQNLNQSILLRMSIGLPPRAEQNRIISRVDEMMALCDRLEERLFTMEGARRPLLDAMLHEALRTPPGSPPPHWEERRSA